MTLAEFLTSVGTMFKTIGEGLTVFMEPPLVWFIVMGAAASVIGILKKLVPKKGAK